VGRSPSRRLLLRLLLQLGDAGTQVALRIHGHDGRVSPYDELHTTNTVFYGETGSWLELPVVPEPDVFFTYMSHRFPRLIANRSGATILNSMH
jgi:hypothetical protein